MNREKKMPPPAADYDTGYCKPPVHTRFKPGRSGNPKGRPKGRKNLATELAEVLALSVDARIGGKVRKTPLGRAMIMAQGIKAAQGDTKAFSSICSAARSAGMLTPELNENQGGGVLLVPKPLTEEEWEKHMAEKRRKEQEREE